MVGGVGAGRGAGEGAAPAGARCGGFGDPPAQRRCYGRVKGRSPYGLGCYNVASLSVCAEGGSFSVSGGPL